MAQTIRNNVQLIGNLGSDPEMHTFESGKVKANLNLATNHSYKNASGEKVEDTQWHQVVAWGKSAEIAGKYLKKGAEVAIQGRLTSRTYEKDGVSRTAVEVLANEILLIGGKRD